MKVALVLVITKTSLFLIKFIFGILINSIALFADAINSGADIVVALGIIIGIKLSTRKPSEKYPYGFHKIENIIELFISIGIFYAGLTILTEGFSHFGTIQTLNPNLGLIITGISLVISLFLAIYLNRKGKQMNSPMILAVSSDSKVDLFSLSLVFIGIGGYYIGFPILEPIMGIFLAFFIFKVAIEIFIHGTKVLLDAMMNYEKLDLIRQLLEAHPQVLAVESLKARSGGRYYFVDAKIKTSIKLIKKGHELKDSLEKDILQKFPELFKVNIYITPERKEYVRIAIPLIENHGLESKISEHFGSAPYFLFFDYKEKAISNINYSQNPFLQQEKQKGIAVAEWLAKNSVDKVFVKEPLKGGAQLALEKHLIDIKLTKESSVRDFLSNFPKN